MCIQVNGRGRTRGSYNWTPILYSETLNFVQVVIITSVIRIATQMGGGVNLARNSNLLLSRVRARTISYFK